MSAFEENDTSFVFLAHWVPTMMNLNIFQNGGSSGESAQNSSP